jgi:hypothetical protein
MNRSYRYKEIYQSYFTRDHTRKLIIFFIYIIDIGDLIIVKISLKYREGIFGYGPKLDPLRKSIAIGHYRPLRASQPQDLYFSEGRYFFYGRRVL